MKCHQQQQIWGFYLKIIEVLVDGKKKPWFRQDHVGIFVGKRYALRSTTKLAGEDQKTLAFLQTEGRCHGMTGWCESKDQQNKMDNFLPLTSFLYMLVNFKK